MPVRRIWYLVSLAGCFVFYVCYQEWLSWILLVCLLGLPWLSLLISLPGILKFQARAEGPAWVTMGEPAEVALMGGSRFPVPPFRGQLRLTRQPSGESWTHRYSLRLSTVHCGAVTATPEKVRCFDYLGLFRFRVRDLTPQTILVRPRPLPMQTVPEMDSYLSRSWRPKPGGGFSENHELRPYRPGDSLNQVHWKLTAKTGDAIIREPMEPQRGLVLLTVDILDTPEELDRKFGRLLWLGYYLLEKGLTYEIHALTGKGVQALPISGPEELERAIDQLLNFPAAAEGSMLDRPLSASWHCHIGGEPDEQ